MSWSSSEGEPRAVLLALCGGRIQKTSQAFELFLCFPPNVFDPHTFCCSLTLRTRTGSWNISSLERGVRRWRDCFEIVALLGDFTVIVSRTKNKTEHLNKVLVSHIQSHENHVDTHGGHACLLCVYISLCCSQPSTFSNWLCRELAHSLRCSPPCTWATASLESDWLILPGQGLQGLGCSPGLSCAFADLWRRLFLLCYRAGCKFLRKVCVGENTAAIVSW